MFTQRKLRGTHYYQLKEIRNQVPEYTQNETELEEAEVHEYNKSFFRSLDVHAKACWRYRIPINASSTAIITFRQNGLRFEYELRPKDFSKFTLRGIEVMFGRLINQLYIKKIKQPNTDDYQKMKALLRLRSVTRHVADTIDFE